MPNKNSIYLLVSLLFSLLVVSHTAVPVPPGYYVAQTITNFNAAVQLFLPLNASLPTKGLVIFSTLTSPFVWTEVCTIQVNVSWSGQAIAANGNLNTIIATSFNLGNSLSTTDNILSFLGPVPQTGNSSLVCPDDAVYQFRADELIGPVTAMAISADGYLLVTGYTNNTQASMNIYDITTEYNLTLTSRIPLLSGPVNTTTYTASLVFSTSPLLVFSRQVSISLNSTNSVEIISYFNPQTTSAGFIGISATSMITNSLDEVNDGVQMSISQNANILTISMAYSKQFPVRMWFNPNPGVPGSIWKPM